MASLGKERENFFRINVLVVDNIKDALMHMFKYYLRRYMNNMSFEEFIGKYMADIRKLRTKTRTLNQKEVDKLIVDNKAISGITVDDLEVTLVKRLLDNLCPQLFMDDSSKTLQDFLKKNQHDIYHLFKFNERCCQCSQDYKFPVTSQLLREDQYKKLFKSSLCTNCAGKSGTVCSVSLCKDTEYILLDYGTRCIVFEHFSCSFKAMQKLIYIRNNAYGHIKAARIPNKFYDEYKQDIGDNIMVLARICGNEDDTRRELVDVQKRSCDETLCIEYQNKFMDQMAIVELKGKVKNIETNQTKASKDIADNRQKIDDINVRHIPLNIRKGHIERIKRWRIEDKPFYDETEGYTAALQMVQSENHITLIGGPGSGKTATARHIALQYEEKGWEVVPVFRLEEIIQYGDRDHEQVFVLDDVLGIFAVDVNNYNYIISHEEQIFTTIGKTSKLLFTSRKSVYKEALALEFFVTENVIDLQRKDNQLTEKQKMAICNYHCKNKNVSPDRYASFLFTDANHMFPFLCKVFSEEEKYQQLGIMFFIKPFEYFIRGLDKLQHTNPIQYAVLVLCLVNDSKLSIKCLPHEHIQEVFNNCRVNLGTSHELIKDAIYHMSETYFTKLDTEYTFIHDFIFEAIAYHYGHRRQNHILKYLSSSYIANKVTVYEQASNEDLCIHISQDMYSPLAERLYKDIQSMNLFDVFMNESLKHGPFLDVFEEMLETKPFNEFESLILRKHENNHHFVQKIPSFKEDIKKQSYMAKHRRLYLLFDSDFKDSFRVISWIINYGHTHLLKEIVKHVECNKHNISLIFGSNVKETRRLLILGCYSNTLDMVELILKYVDPKGINMDYGASSDIEYNFCTMYTPLMAACTTGNLCIVKALLRSNADVNECDDMKESPLFVATEYGHIDVVRCLLSSGADVNFCDSFGQSPLSKASRKGHCDIVKYLVAHNADVNLTDRDNRSPLYSASKMGHYDIALFLLQNETDVNISDVDKKSSLYVASSSGHYDIVKLLIAHGALSAGNAQSQFKTISKRTKGNEIHSESNALLPDVGNTSPLSIAVQEGHLDIVKYIIENSTDFDLSDTGKSPLFLAAEEGYHDILVLLLHSKYNDIAKTYLGTTPLEIAVWRNKTKVVQLLIQEENKLKKYQGNYHLFEILVDLKRSEFCINEKTGKEDCHAKDRNHRHLPYPLWHIITEVCNEYLTHLLKIGLDINKRDNNGNTLLYKILYNNEVGNNFESLMEHFEDVNAGETKWILLLKTKRREVRCIESNFRITNFLVETLSEFRKHIRRHSI